MEHVAAKEARIEGFMMRVAIWWQAKVCHRRMVSGQGQMCGSV